jgi:hypothetical protein
MCCGTRDPNQSARMRPASEGYRGRRRGAISPAPHLGRQDVELAVSVHVADIARVSVIMSRPAGRVRSISWSNAALIDPS